ncbi:MAG: nucleotidyltransferase domain-containing protein [Bacteroidetes bacterium]|nr:nucleotidyltransferase domain-containing protein [Bacteroidota bacterium]
MRDITSNIDQIKKLCNLYNVRSLFAFGSITTNKDQTNSDIDLVVDIDSSNPITYSNNYFSLKFQLEQLLNRKIDLLEQKAIKNPYLKKQIDQTKVLVYGR